MGAPAGLEPPRALSGGCGCRADMDADTGGEPFQAPLAPGLGGNRREFALLSGVRHLGPLLLLPGRVGGGRCGGGRLAGGVRAQPARRCAAAGGAAAGPGRGGCTAFLHLADTAACRGGPSRLADASLAAGRGDLPLPLRSCGHAAGSRPPRPRDDRSLSAARPGRRAARCGLGRRRLDLRPGSLAAAGGRSAARCGGASASPSPDSTTRYGGSCAGDALPVGGVTPAVVRGDGSGRRGRLHRASAALWLADARFSRRPRRTAH